MYLLVCFNVVLDLLMGCSSGGAAVEPLESLNSDQTVRMMHFRTLDWGMPSLRRVLILLDFVLEPNGEPVASTVTYAGYVGVLTGVRKDLSLSLNFRATHNSDGHFVNVKYYWHHLMVLLGLRRSISSILRAHLIPRTYMKTSASSSLEASRLPTYGDIVAEASCRQQPVLTTACYLCFSSGVETTVIEKDLSTAVLASSTDFIVVTNADASTLSNNSPFESDLQETKRKSKVLNMALEELDMKRMIARHAPSKIIESFDLHFQGKLLSTRPLPHHCQLSRILWKWCRDILRQTKAPILRLSWIHSKAKLHGADSGLSQSARRGSKSTEVD